MIKRLLGMHNQEYKQVILVRSDLRLKKGKMAAQVAHASVETVLQSRRAKVMRWRRGGMKKVVLKVANQEELEKYRTLANEMGLVAVLITDAGRTAVAAGTVTCCGIGPDSEERLDAITGDLKMM